MYSREIIDKYRDVLIKTPESPVFAPLAEAYRENGDLALAEKVCKDGLKKNPLLVSAWVTLGRILKDRKNWDEAIRALQHAIKLAPNNILAHLHIGEAHLENRNTKEAINSFKMVLLLNPSHLRAKKLLERIESLTAADYGDELFEFKKLRIQSEDPYSAPEHTTTSIIDPNKPDTGSKYNRTLNRVLSLVDAFIARNQLKQAISLIDNHLAEFPNEKEIQHRIKIIRSRTSASLLSESELANDLDREQSLRNKEKKLKKLNDILFRIQTIRTP